MELIPLDDANGDLPLVRVTGGGVTFPPGLPGQLVGYDAEGQPVAVNAPEGTLPPGVEGQLVGYGPGGLPVAVDAPEVGGYDDAPLVARVDTLEVAAQGVAATFEVFDQAFTAGIATTAAQSRQYTDQAIAALPPPVPGPPPPVQIVTSLPASPVAGTFYVVTG